MNTPSKKQAADDVDNLPKPDEYWDRPKQKNHGDKKADWLYSAVGLALSAWEITETRFALLFALFVYSDYLNSAACRAYGAIESNSGRRKALDAAADVFLNETKVLDTEQRKTMLRKFKILIVHFEKASQRRDDIAHGIVTGTYKNDTSLGIFLGPPQYNTHRTNFHQSKPLLSTDSVNMFGWKYRFTHEDIGGFSVKFSRLASAVDSYLKMLKLNCPQHSLDSRHDHKPTEA